MSDLQVIPVESRREKRAFMRLLWQIYRADPNWIPPLVRNQEELVGFRRHPFHQVAEVQAFLALRDNEPCGRVLGIINHRHNERFGEKRGFFGFFESVDDQAVANGLIDAVRHWLAERGIKDVRGPVNPSLNYEVGLLVDGFDSPPTFMMTYNPPYYPKLLETYGFRKVQDAYAFWGHLDMLDSLDKKLEFVVKEATSRFDVTTRRMDTSKFAKEVRLFLEIYNKSLVGTWGFAPMSEGEVDHLSASLKHLIAPEMTTIAEVDGRPVGALFGLLDYNPRIKAINGRLMPFGFLKLLRNRKAIKKVRMISTNVLPEYQRWGLGLVSIARLVPEFQNWGIEEVEFSWVLESNHLSYKTLKRGGAHLIKTYRIYDFAPQTDEPDGVTE